LDHYLRETRGFKKVMITLSSLEPFALSGMLSATVQDTLGKHGKPLSIMLLVSIPLRIDSIQLSIKCMNNFHEYLRICILNALTCFDST